LAQATAWVVRNRTPVTAPWLLKAPRLQVIGRLGVGLDNIDLAACRERGLPVVYAKSANAAAVVEYVLTALLWSVRPWIDWVPRTKAGEWNRRLGGHELFGRTLGILGLGDIGSRVARTAHQLGMRIVAYDPHVSPYHALASDGTVMLVDSLEAVLEMADAVTLHLPQNPHTWHLMNASRLERMKPQATLINTARGGLIDEQALYAVLSQGHLRHVFLDVREEEPPPEPDPLATVSRVYLTPHIAGLTEEALVRTTRLVLDDVRLVLEGKPARNVVRHP